MNRPIVLLVEDNHLLRWWVTKSLERAGCQVFIAQSPEEAARLAGHYAFDVLITDWRLGDGRNGEEVLKHVRAIHPAVLAILISAEADPEMRQRARKSGFDRVMEKPLLVADVIGAVLKAPEVAAIRAWR